MCHNTDNKYKRNYYRYYDTPEGCDILKKIMVTTRYGLITGLIAGTYDIVMYSHVIHLGPMFNRYLYHVVPLSLMGATFSTVANGLVRYRCIDDHLNYFAGGFACGPILGAYLRSKHAVLITGLALGLIGVFKKESIETGFVFLRNFPSHQNGVNSWRADFTLVKDPRDELVHSCTPGVKGGIKK